MSRIEITVDGKFMLGTSIKDPPTDHKELVQFLKDLVDFLESPDVPDEEVLGMYSPPKL